MNTFAHLAGLMAIVFFYHEASAQLESVASNFIFPREKNSFFAQNDFDSLVYDAEGRPLFGTEFVAMLYGGGTTDSLRPAVEDHGGPPMDPVPFDLIPGLFLDSPVVYVESIDNRCGGLSWLRVRAWDTRMAPTYEAAVELGIGGYGESDLFMALGGDACDLQSAPRRLVGLESFDLLPVIPEPSPALLLLLGGPMVLWRLWRKRMAQRR